MVSETKPDVVVAIDALGGEEHPPSEPHDTDYGHGGSIRLGWATIASVSPRTIFGKVIGIGVPTVVDAATIVYDSMAHLLEALDEAEQKEFLEEMISPNLHSMFVTPKDVDETVKYLSFTLQRG